MEDLNVLPCSVLVTSKLVTHHLLVVISFIGPLLTGYDGDIDDDDNDDDDDDDDDGDGNDDDDDSGVDDDDYVYFHLLI